MVSWTLGFFGTLKECLSECIKCTDKLKVRNHSGHLTTGGLTHHLQIKHSFINDNYQTFKGEKPNLITSYTSHNKEKFEVLSEMVVIYEITQNQIIKSSFIRSSFKAQGWKLLNFENTVGSIICDEAKIKKVNKNFL
ncbi:MAG: hypothetical protein MHPSP_000507 [Paramarteilia canceri]